MRLGRRSFAAVIGTALLAAAAGVQAQAWPTKPIRLIAPFPP